MTSHSLAVPADLLIAGYQRYVSPYKGFCCAYRVHTGRASCSTLGRRVIRAHGLFGGLVLLSQRFRRCQSSALALQQAALSEAAGPEGQEAATPAVAGNEPATKDQTPKKSACNVNNASCCVEVSACACAPFT